MHEPRPYGLAVEGGELTGDDRLFIDHVVRKVTNFKQTSQLENIKYTRTLPDGGFVIVYDMGGIFKAIAYKEQESEQRVSEEGFAPLDVPMLFSGMVVDGRSFYQRGVSLSLTDMCCRRVGNYSGVIADKSQILKRFAIRFNPKFRELEPEAAQVVDENKTLFSQYIAQHPTWYSGAMAEVMQIVAGYGKQKLDELPDYFVERAVFTIPDKYLDRIKEKLKDVRLPAYTGQVEETGEFQYSYKFNKTHLVSFDEENNPWLIQIEPNHVWAMPLPMIPVTMTPEFREYVEHVGDHELEAILDRFGGLPSGEGFPRQDTFHSWVRAGVIIKVCDTADFYHYSSYSSACGWSCNLRGTEIVNTCYDLRDIFYYGYTYMLKLNLAVAKDRGLLKKTTVSGLTEQQARQVAAYVGGIYALLRENADVRLPCLMYKLRLVGLPDILAKAGGRVTESDIAYWDNLVLPPIASHSGEVVRTNEGYLYDGIALKLPEPVFKGCISMLWIPSNEGKPYVHPRCDTIVFAYYIGDDLKVIKSFHDKRTHIQEVTGNFEEYMLVGAWEQVETQGLTGLAGDYYSTDFDDRVELAPVTITTNIVGTDAGYGTPRAVFSAHFFMDGILSRARYYRHKTNIERTNGQALRNAFVVNYLNRNMCSYFKQQSSSGGFSTETYSQHGAFDPNTYDFWTYDAGSKWIGVGVKKATGKPYPQNGYPVWAEIHNYHHDGTARSDFADNGDWLGGLPKDISNYLVDDHHDLSYGGIPPAFSGYSNTVNKSAAHASVCKASLLSRAVEVHKNAHADAIYRVSPDENMVVLDIDACKVVFGSAVYANIDTYDNRYKFGYTKLATHKSAHFFIGVINE